MMDDLEQKARFDKAREIMDSQLIEVLRDPDLLDGAKQHYLDVLAERLKLQEQERDDQFERANEWRSQAEKMRLERDQLTADLAQARVKP